MKHFRSALLGMVILLCLLYSCSTGETDSEETEEPVITEKPAITQKPGLEETGEPAAKEPAAAEEPGSGETGEPAAEKPAAGTEGEEAEDGEPEHPDDTPDSSPGDDEDIPDDNPPHTQNSRVPALQINELRTEYSNPRVEFIELKILSAGNLEGLRVFAMSNKEPMIYEFKSVEVNAGEYVVLHLRTLEKSCIDEYGRLDESGGTDSCPTARDFWIPGENKLLNKTDVVYVLDQDGKVLDAIMIVEDPNAWKDKNYFPETADFLCAQDAWKSAAGGIPGPADAVNTSEIRASYAKSISRKETVENTHTAADWYIAIYESSTILGSTPGLPNKPRP